MALPETRKTLAVGFYIHISIQKFVLQKRIYKVPQPLVFANLDENLMISSSSMKVSKTPAPEWARSSPWTTLTAAQKSSPSLNPGLQELLQQHFHSFVRLQLEMDSLIRNMWPVISRVCPLFLFAIKRKNRRPWNTSSVPVVHNIFSSYSPFFSVFIHPSPHICCPPRPVLMLCIPVSSLCTKTWQFNISLALEKISDAPSAANVTLSLSLWSFLPPPYIHLHPWGEHPCSPHSVPVAQGKYLSLHPATHYNCIPTCMPLFICYSKHVGFAFFIQSILASLVCLGKQNLRSRPKHISLNSETVLLFQGSLCSDRSPEWNTTT